MHRVYVAWDQDDAKRFSKVLESHGIHGKIIEDREFPVRGEAHDTEMSPEVWIADTGQVARALELALDFESERRQREVGKLVAEANAGAAGEPEPEPKSGASGAGAE